MLASHVNGPNNVIAFHVFNEDPRTTLQGRFDIKAWREHGDVKIEERSLRSRGASARLWAVTICEKTEKVS